MCVTGIDFDPVFLIFRLKFGTVQTVGKCSLLHPHPKIYGICIFNDQPFSCMWLL